MNSNPFKIHTYSKSGKLRINDKIINKKKENEDSKKVDIYRGIFIVADGMGGHTGGKIASQHATLMLYQNMCDLLKIHIRDNLDDSLVKSLLSENVEDTNKFVYAISRLPHLSKCGTTIDAVMIHNAKLYGAHVGDGSVYKINTLNNSIDRLTSVDKFTSFNNSLNPMEQELVFSKNVSTALGSETISIQDYMTEISHSDIILMATDGFTKKVHPDEMLESFKNKTFEEGVESLKKYCRNPKGMRQVVKNLKNKEYNINERYLFSDDTTFIAIKRND